MENVSRDDLVSNIEILDHSLVQDYLDTGAGVDLQMQIGDYTIYAYNEKNHFVVQVEDNNLPCNNVVESEMCNYWDDVRREFHHYVYKYMKKRIDECESSR